ncbi:MULTISPECIES: plasmid IncI1-type surface exclusion protein ExcA [Pseudomonas syringae group]|uniref:Ethanolamine utilization protein EutG n=10 Tax=Pseudomonas syringae group TaxID=136849 RepID=A0A330JYW0_PSESX|nr:MULTISPECIES: plasmid IncI1-type surface exclusion protein ExcA [Pseudomonas syringae group]PPS25838.1 ethanolamine utilization protein EutG [Pseudomonas amygdali pv. morsprunorum]KAA8701064.1 plasmid IncI1-type surface exclusion protein ExcA [Pseudomonas cannabina]KPW81376.1 putative Exclusion-determining protein [Pseudomonas cannabina]KPX35121.1 putative Exclusion-determining protein [Pseudomonas amygdali pv. eriobotryae]KWS80192.1 ethanolamine utilization protein EutG [Pseudomonas amygda
MKVQRLKTAKEGWFWIVKIFYMLFAFPFAVLVGVPSLFIASSLIEEKDFTTLGFCSMLWLGVLIPMGIFIYGVLSRRRLLKRVTRAIKSPQFFNPDPTNEIYHEGDGKYLGIDTKNGTILYVHRIRKGQVDVVALTMDDWTNREVEGKGILRLYTKHPDLPRIEIGTPLAQLWYDTLGAMEHKQKQYSTPQPFNRYVHDRLEALERDLNVQIPRLA